MNKVHLLGRIGSDYRDSVTPSGKPCIEFLFYITSIGRHDYNCVNLTVTGKKIDILRKYCRKGDRIAVVAGIDGRLRTLKGGEKRLDVRIVAHEIYFAETMAELKRENAAEFAAGLEEVSEKLENINAEDLF